MIYWKKIDGKALDGQEYLLSQKVLGKWFYATGRWEQKIGIWDTNYEGDIEPTHYAKINDPDAQTGPAHVLRMLADHIDQRFEMSQDAHLISQMIREEIIKEIEQDGVITVRPGEGFNELFDRKLETLFKDEKRAR